MTEREYLGYGDDVFQWAMEQEAELQADLRALEGDEQAQIDAAVADHLDGYDPAEPWMDSYLDAWARGDD
jgi:hypothetical protein